jgi:hypothetical protein
MGTIKEAAILARRLVLNENRLASLQRCNAPEKIIAMEKERLWEFKEKVEENPLVTELLPQARKVLAMENARSTYLRTQTFLGNVEAKIDECCDAKVFDETHIFLTGSDEEMLTRFMNTSAKGDARKILLDLKEILPHVRFDIEKRTDVPHPPPQFRITAAQKFAFTLGNVLKEEEE